MKRFCRNLWEQVISFFKTSYPKYKNVSNFGNLYLLPKIHKRLQNAPGRPVISNFGTPTEKASEFLDYQLKPIMKRGKSYIEEKLAKHSRGCNLGYNGCSRSLSQYSSRNWFECAYGSL